MQKPCKRSGGGIWVIHRQLLKQKYIKAYIRRSAEEDAPEHGELEQGSCFGSVVEEIQACCSEAVDCSTVDSAKNSGESILASEREQCRPANLPFLNLEESRVGGVAPHDGYMLAGVAIIASVLGRLSSEEIRYDASRLFRKQESSRLLNAELRRKRQEWKEQEEVRLAMEQRRRVEEVTEKARIEAERQKKIQEKYEKEAREEGERRKKELEASRREY